jgi:uncharacterized protein
MTPQTFNPFEDRLSRDIRNDLSETIFEVLDSGSLAAAEHAASGYRRQDLERIYAEYIEQRLERYGRALATLPNGASLIKQAAVLWDLHLFFEVHEILEPAWIAADGDNKRLLQALIRAAGVYINLELGYTRRAAKIAGKTLPVLQELRTNLISQIDIGSLIDALESLSKKPPRIGLP